MQDAPITIEAGPGQEAWTPSNFDGKSGGPHTLRYGIEHSKNLMTVRLAKDVGMPLIAEYARRFGVYDDMLPVLPMSLGAGETTVMRMVTAYSMLANGGRRIRPTLIDRIQDRIGETIYRHDDRKCIGCDAEKWSGQDEPKLVDDSRAGARPADRLPDGLDHGGRGPARHRDPPEADRQAARRQDRHDERRQGRVVRGLLAGSRGRHLYRLRQAALARRPRHRRRAYAAPIALEFLKVALKDKPPTPFRVPPGIKLIRVNLGSGTRAGSGEGAGTILEAFKPGTAPPDSYVAPRRPERGARRAVPADADRAAQAGGLY